jgi:hypothetical protein
VNRGGAEYSRRYYEHIVGPAVDARWPVVPRAAGRLGSGSDVLGLDDDVSRDHDWGLRLNLFVPADMTAEVDAYLEEILPATFDGLPTRFATTWDPRQRHRVQVQDVAAFVHSHTGLDVRNPLSVNDWLSLSGQSVMEVTAGPVFIDTDGALTDARSALAWYPDDVWKYVIAADWSRLAQELPFVGRSAERGDDLGSRVIPSRLVGVAMHLAHLLDRQWPAYSKWLGTSLARLPRAHAIAEALGRVLSSTDWRDRRRRFRRRSADPQPDPGRRWVARCGQPNRELLDRAYRSIRPDVITALEDSISDPAVKALPRGLGSVEQWSDNTNVLTNPSRRLLPPSPSH